MSRKKHKKELKICETKIQAINNLKKYGFCLIKNAISKNDTIELKNKLKKIGCEEDSKNGISSTVLQIKGMENKRITLNTNDVFEKEVAIRAGATGISILPISLRNCSLSSVI